MVLLRLVSRSACRPSPPTGLAGASRLGGWLPACLWLLFSQLPYGWSTAQAEDLHAERIYAWEFQRSEDRNLDQWPDGWRRRAGRDFPAYIPVRIVPRDAEVARVARQAEPALSRLWMKYSTGRYLKDFIPESTPEPIAQFMDSRVVNNCLSIDMDGGAVQLESPAFPLDSRFTYALDASVTTRGLDGHQVWFELLLLDPQGQVLEQAPSAESSGTTAWHRVSTGHLSSTQAHMGQVVIHIQPLKTRRLNGNVRIDEIRLYRMPKLELSVDAPFHVTTPNQLVNVKCLVLGVADARSSVNFKLVDHMGQLCDQTVASLVPMTSPASNAALTAAPPVPRSPGASSIPVASSIPAGKLTTTNNLSQPASSNAVSSSEGSSKVVSSKDLVDSRRLDGIALWPLRVPQPGYYRIIVDLGRTAQNGQAWTISRETSLAVIDSSRATIGGPFGWSLPGFDNQFTPETVPELAKLGGVGWLKIPVWFQAQDVQMAERLSVLLERLDLRKITCVGLLEQPLDKEAKSPTRPPAAATFGSPEDWEAELEPALTRMSMKLTWFQLGRDHDRSFIGNPNLIPLMTDIRNRMQTYSQEMQLALAWDYQDPLPETKNLPWRACQMACEPQLTATELRSHLADAPKSDCARWVTLNPISAKRYRTLDRIRDLTERMIAVKQHRVEAAFLTTPIDRDTGIFNPDGSVGELFLPWRVLNQHLAGASFLGSFNMPGGSTNFVFSEGQTGFMILWSDKPTIEQLYLGDDVQATDLWGRPLPLEQTLTQWQSSEQKLNVNAWPILLRGINIAVARWRMQFKLENNQLPSMVGLQTDLPISVENTLGHSVYGTINLYAPTLLQSNNAATRFQMGEGSSQKVQLPIPVRGDASAGKHLLRFDVQATAERDLRFSVYDSLTLGIGDVELAWEVIELESQQAALRVELTNLNHRPVSFDCLLFPPRLPYRRFQIMNAPPGTSQYDLVLPLESVVDRDELNIKCEEIGSNRVLNYRLPLATVGN